MGSGALFSKWYGAGKIKEMQQDVQLSFYFIGTATLLIYLIVFPGTDIILHLVSVPDNIYNLMRTYIKIVFIGIGFTFLYNFFAYLLRSTGNSVVPLYFLAISSIMSLTASPLGVGLAVLSNIIAAALLVVLLAFMFKSEKIMFKK